MYLNYNTISLPSTRLENDTVNIVYYVMLADFLADVNSLRMRYDVSFPTLVHCSAGVGRSGVVVLMDMLIAMVDCGDVSNENTFVGGLLETSSSVSAKLRNRLMYNHYD